MTTDDLWHQILVSPADRPLYARFVEALTKHHDPRAEIFRLAAELIKFPPYYVQHEGLKKQYEAALAPWRCSFEVKIQPWCAQIVFVHGWPMELTLPAASFAAHAADIIATLPIRHLNVTAIADAPNFFAVPQLRQMASLNFRGANWTAVALQALTTSGNLAALRWLDLSRGNLADADVERLAAALNLRQIEHLDLTRNPCRDPVDAAAGYGTDWATNSIVPESICLPEFGRELEIRHGKIHWLHALDHFMEKHPPSRYTF